VQVLRLLVDEPNVMLLDEPTNDLDVDTLTELEDLLDRWPGSLLVVSHDRYFLQRVTDHVVALLGDGKLSYLAGGIDEYLARRVRWAPVRGLPRRASRVPMPEGALVLQGALDSGRPVRSGRRVRNYSAWSGRSTGSARGRRSCRPRSPRRPATTTS